MIHLFLFFTYSKIRCSEGTHFIDKHILLYQENNLLLTSFYTKNYFFQQVTDEQQNVQ